MNNPDQNVDQNVEQNAKPKGFWNTWLGKILSFIGKYTGISSGWNSLKKWWSKNKSSSQSTDTQPGNVTSGAVQDFAESMANTIITQAVNGQSPNATHEEPQIQKHDNTVPEKNGGKIFEYPFSRAVK
ncbi:hypothetical protein [Wolbachia endosymbiont of Ctenocephalides felis wCfeT]|uniref:hypothetical protein n=1 Tax=Wolbachia endosymbiont of Ctenocephalides felis wCfeT TaxID=2732593 RepID=UPI001445FD4D|nr:hypothetical protein [Wolbachia endosymbiont of Ctenocephalides felis wCfeT]